MRSMSNQMKKTALYCRLSQDDGLEGDSNSDSESEKSSCKSLQKTITFPIPASMWMTVFPVEISKGPHFSR